MFGGELISEQTTVESVRKVENHVLILLREHLTNMETVSPGPLIPWELYKKRAVSLIYLCTLNNVFSIISYRKRRLG